MYHFKECGLENVHLVNGYEEIETPSGKAVKFQDLDGLHQAISKWIVEKAEPLNGKEFRFLRVELDLSQKALGGIMEKSDQTIANWEKGIDPVPVLADKALRDLYSESINTLPIAGLLKRLSEVDRELHEKLITLKLLEHERHWEIQECA